MLLLTARAPFDLALESLGLVILVAMTGWTPTLAA